MKKIIMIFAFFILIILNITAQEESQTGAEVTLTISSQRAAPGETLTLTLIIDYPMPDNIAVYVPHYAEFLSLDRFATYTRTIASRLHTVVEYRFIAIRAGVFTLDAFTIICPLGTTETSPLVIEIISPGAAQTVTPLLYWERIPDRIMPGDRITLVLRSDNWRSQQPQPAFFMPQVPQGVILSALPVSPQERTSGVIIKLMFISLAEGEIIFPARTLVQNNVRFEIPSLIIRAGP